jgi:hypothetical protein
MTPVVALARFTLRAKAHAKVPLSNTTVSGLPLNFRKFKSVQKHGLYAVPTFVPAQADFQLVLLTKIAFGVGKILIDKRR